jgi:hypothetical protein
MKGIILHMKNMFAKNCFQVQPQLLLTWGWGNEETTETPWVWECVHRASKESSMSPWHKEALGFFLLQSDGCDSFEK